MRYLLLLNDPGCKVSSFVPLRSVVEFFPSISVLPLSLSLFFVLFFRFLSVHCRLSSRCCSVKTHNQQTFCILVSPCHMLFLCCHKGLVALLGLNEETVATMLSHRWRSPLVRREITDFTVSSVSNNHSNIASGSLQEGSFAESERTDLNIIEDKEKENSTSKENESAPQNHVATVAEDPNATSEAARQPSYRDKDKIVSLYVILL